MKQQIERLVADAVLALPGDVLPADARLSTGEIERTRDSRHGDFASNVAMKLARAAGKSPRELAGLIVETLPDSELVSKVEIAGPGFINIHLAPIAYHREIGSVLDRKENYGKHYGEGPKVIVEFISANPTGPLHVGHGRHAAYGACVADLLAAVGYRVHREYYVNDAGRQMDILTVSVWLRYLEALGERVVFPSVGYRGDYIREIAEQLQRQVGDGFRRDWQELSSSLPPDVPEGDGDEHIDALIRRTRELLGDEGLGVVLDTALENILADIRDVLEHFGVVPDSWFSERSLARSGAIDRAIERLEAGGYVYRKDGALWFKAEELGDEKDRVVVRDNGQTTYFASDIAYHLYKRECGYELLLDVLGADHHGYVARVRAGLIAMGEPGDSLEVPLVQFVALFRGGQKVQMATRSGEFVTLRELLAEIGKDAARFFYVMRSNDQHLDFDLELAKSRSQDNPVYYIQYAHARICSVMQQLTERGLTWDEEEGREHLGLLDEAHELALMNTTTRFPEVVELAANNRAPHTVAYYLKELATDFHTYYNAHTFLVDDERLRNARLTLIHAVQQVLRNGLELLGVSAPESM